MCVGGSFHSIISYIAYYHRFDQSKQTFFFYTHTLHEIPLTFMIYSDNYNSPNLHYWSRTRTRSSRKSRSRNIKEVEQKQDDQDEDENKNKEQPNQQEEKCKRGEEVSWLIRYDMVFKSISTVVCMRQT